MKYDAVLERGTKIFTESGLEFKIHIREPNVPLNLRNHITYHSWYEIIFVPHAGLVHHINGTTRKVQSNSLLLIRPQDICDFEMPAVTSNTNKLYYIYQITIEDWLMETILKYLSPEVSVENMLYSALPPLISLNKMDGLSLLNQISIINTFPPEQRTNFTLTLKQLIITLLTKYFFSETQRDTSTDDTIPMWLLRTMQAMHYPNNFSQGVARMVELSGKSNEHLIRCMKKFYNITPLNYINNIRVSYAANLLINSALSVTDICYECGFQSPSWMGIRFKEKYGLSPSEYRETFTPPPKNN